MAKSSHRNFGYNQSAEQNEIENMRDRRGKRIFRKERNIDGTTNYVQKSTGNTVTFDNSVGPKPKERVAYGSGNYEINKAATAAARENTFENSGKSFAENYTRERNRLQEEQWERDAHGGKLKSEWDAIRAKDEEANRQRFFKQNFDTLDAQLQKQGDAEIKAQNIMQGKRIAAAQFLANVMLNGGSLARGLCDDFSNLLGTTVNGASFDRFGNFGFQYDDGNGGTGTQFVSRDAVRKSIEGTFGSVSDFLARYQGRIPDNLAHALLGDDIYEKNGEMARIGEQMDAQRMNFHRDTARFNRGNAETDKRIDRINKQIESNNAWVKSHPEQFSRYDKENAKLEAEKKKLEEYRAQARNNLNGGDAAWLSGAAETEASRSNDAVIDAWFAAMIENPRNDLNREEAEKYRRDAEEIAVAQDRLNKTPRPMTAEAQAAYKKQIDELSMMKDEFVSDWKIYESEKEKRAKRDAEREETAYQRKEAAYQAALKDKESARNAQDARNKADAANSAYDEISKISDAVKKLRETGVDENVVAPLVKRLEELTSKVGGQSQPQAQMPEGDVATLKAAGWSDNSIKAVRTAQKILLSPDKYTREQVANAQNAIHAYEKVMNAPKK